jgi:roadblock/LC7 domain-containing protein
MAGHRVTTNTEARPDPALAAYLSDLATRLGGPRHRRETILTELRDGLDQATDEHIAAGLPPERATIAAIAQFGTPQAVADAFGDELAIAHVRHTIARFIATGPLVGIWWLLLLHPSPWRTGLIALVAAIPVIPLIVVAIATAAGAFATTGRLMRWLPEIGPRKAVAAIAAIAALCLIGDLTMITVFSLSGMPTRPLAVIAIAASLTRIACSITALRHITRMRSR